MPVEGNFSRAQCRNGKADDLADDKNVKSSRSCANSGEQKKSKFDKNINKIHNQKS